MLIKGKVYEKRSWNGERKVLRLIREELETNRKLTEQVISYPLTIIHIIEGSVSTCFQYVLTNDPNDPREPLR